MSGIATQAAWRGDAHGDHGDLEHALIAAARSLLAAVLTPEALGLYRLVVSESVRFPEIGQALQEAGLNVGIARVAALLRRYTRVEDPEWASEQFQRLVMSGPQSRAIGFGARLGEADLDDWASRSVAFFLRAIGVAGETRRAAQTLEAVRL